jgi:hypothetical protein
LFYPEGKFGLFHSVFPRSRSLHDCLKIDQKFLSFMFTEQFLGSAVPVYFPLCCFVHLHYYEYLSQLRNHHRYVAKSSPCSDIIGFYLIPLSWSRTSFSTPMTCSCPRTPSGRTYNCSVSLGSSHPEQSHFPGFLFFLICTLSVLCGSLL